MVLLSLTKSAAGFVSAVTCFLALSALPSVSALSSTQYVVTGLKVVEAPTLAEALEKCQGSSPFVTAGIDLTTNDNTRVVQLCQLKERVEYVTAAQRQQQGSKKVLQRIAVYTATTACPERLQLLFSPRADTVVCAQFAPALTAFATGNYVNDLTVTVERNYNNEVPGWETIPFSVNDDVAATGNRGAFINFQRPVVPISALQVLTDVDFANSAQACASQFGTDWEQAGQGFISHALDTKKTLLCVQRSAQLIAFQVLTDVAVVHSAENCTSEFSQKQSIANGFSVCSKWDNRAVSEEFVADLKLLRLASSELSALNGQPVIPGGFAPALLQDLNQGLQNAVAYLVFRKTKVSTMPSQPQATKQPLKAKFSNELVQGPGLLSFKILQVADMHYTGNPLYPCRNVPMGMSASECTESVMTKFIDDLLDLEKPDFVVFTGDNVEVLSPELRQVAMDTATKGVEDRNIPFAMVFGNHDDENGFSREDIVKIAESKKNSYVQRGPLEVDGVGNYELSIQIPVNGPWGAAGKDAFRMYFLDSHGYPNRAKYPFVSASYDWVKQNQIDYYRQLSNAHAIGNNKVPALMFFHIPLVEYAAAPASKKNGEEYETVASADVSTNHFSTLVELNEVKATFVGHDHVNEYCYLREGIQLCYGGGVGFGRAYGWESFARRARVIEWSVDSANKRTIKSWKRHFGNLTERQLEEVLYSEVV